MVSFDSAVMFGTPIKDFGKWQTEVKPVWQSELENPEMPEIWWFRQTKEAERKSRESPAYYPPFKIRSVPALTPQAHQVSMRGYVTLKNITEFVMLRQPNTDMVLLLIPADKYFNALGSPYPKNKFHPPYYLQITEMYSNIHSYLNLNEWDARRLVEVRNFGRTHSGQLKLLNWNDSQSLLDYFKIGPNPTRPFLWYLELVEWNGRRYLERNYEEGGKGGSIYMPYSTAGYRPLVENSSKGLLPTTKKERQKPRVAWQPKGHRLTNPQWAADPLWLEKESETFGIPTEPTGAIAGFVTNHFLDRWKKNRYGPNENRSLRSFGLTNWKQIPMHFWQSLLSPPQNDIPYGVKLIKGGVPLAYIVYRRTFNRRRNRPELELITIKPPSRLQSQGRGVHGAHSRTTEYPKNPVRLKAESLLERNAYGIMMAETHPKGLCPICSGPIPNEKHRGKYPGALSRWDNESEICSACGTAEALSPMMDARALDLMMEAREENDFALWVMGVRLGRPHVDEMMEAQQKAHEELKEMGMTEHKVMIDGEWVDWEERN
jgi:hypothetical protein